MSGEVIVDALPYIDQGYDNPGVREAALAMVEEECRRYKPTKNYLEHLGLADTTTFETALLKNELERIANRLPMEGLSMKRYELPPPPPGKLSDVGAWTESVKNSMAQLEHQSVRAINLELMTEYGCESWKSNLEVLTALQAKAQVQLQELRKEIQEVNWQRKSKQMQAGDKLRALEAHWVMLVSKNYEIEQACAALEEEIYTLKSKRKVVEEPATNGHSKKEEEEDADEDDQDMKMEEKETPMDQSEDTNSQDVKSEPPPAPADQEDSSTQQEPEDPESKSSDDVQEVKEESMDVKEDSGDSEDVKEVPENVKEESNEVDNDEDSKGSTSSSSSSE